MLEVDYELKRYEGAGHERIFRVEDRLKKIEGNGAYIKAPNAKGKSTFLNILALALYGDRLEEADSRISESLRSDIKYMTSRRNQNYTFSVKITSKDGSIKLVSTKSNLNSNDIRVKEINNGKERDLPFQTFKNEYFLVYDIPEDPLNRINEILSDVKNQQIRYLNKIKDFIKYIGAVKQDISHSRNELEIESTRESITEFENKSEILLRLHNETEEKIKIIETFLALREFENYIAIYLTLNEKIEEKEKTNIKQKKVVKKFNTQYVNKKKSIINKINNMNDSVSIVTFKIESLFIERNKEEIITHITSIRDLNLHDCINTYHVNKVFLSEIYYFKGQLESYLKDKEIKESGIKGSFYKELLVILQQYQSLEITLPGIDKSISEFVFLINNELENNKQLRSIFDELSECIKIIDKIESDFKVIPKDLETLEFLYNKKEEKLSLLDDDEKTDSETEELQTEIKSSLKKIEFYKRLAEKNGISIDEDSGSSEIIQLRDKVVKENLAFSQIFMLSEKSFLEEISKMREQLESIKNRLSQNNNILGQYRAKLHDLESRKPHKLYKYSNQIDELSKKVDNLHQNFTEYDNFIRKISSGEKLTSAIETEYNEGISKYFANKIPEFPYINEFLKPQKIDFLNKLIILDNGREIDMKDISTGQSMSMYIQAVLNRPSDDKRRMVVIFDEGATMDSRSFEPIKKVLEKNTSENKVLFSVFAKAVDEELTVTKLI